MTKDYKQAVELVDGLIKNSLEKIETLKELKKALAHEHQAETDPVVKSNMTITLNGFKDLIKKYDIAVENKDEQFDFQGKTLLTSYAKYLIEYLEGEMFDNGMIRSRRQTNA